MDMDMSSFASPMDIPASALAPVAGPSSPEEPKNYQQIFNRYFSNPEWLLREEWNLLRVRLHKWNSVPRKKRPEKNSPPHKQHLEDVHRYTVLAAQIWDLDYADVDGQKKKDDDAKNSSKGKKKVTFDSDPDMRSEEWYRERSDFKRGSYFYTPGRWSAQNGQEFYDTSFLKQRGIKFWDTYLIWDDDEDFHERKAEMLADADDDTSFFESVGGFLREAAGSLDNASGAHEDLGDAMDVDITDGEEVDDELASQQHALHLPPMSDSPSYDPFLHSSNGNIGSYFMARDLDGSVRDTEQEIEDWELEADDDEQMSESDFEMEFLQDLKDLEHP